MLNLTIRGKPPIDQPNKTQAIKSITLTIFNTNICDYIWSTRIVYVSLHIERNKLTC